MPIPDEPITRREQFYSSILGDGTPPDPITREEMYLYEIAQNGGGGGGGGTAGVTSFNGRRGIVRPQAGDYTAAQVNTSTAGKSVQAAIDELSTAVTVDSALSPTSQHPVRNSAITNKFTEVEGKVVPAGGVAGAVLAKTSGSDHALEWKSPDAWMEKADYDSNSDGIVDEADVADAVKSGLHVATIADKGRDVTLVSDADKGIANGVVPLDSSRKILPEYLPDSIMAGLTYGGVFNATTRVVELTPAAKSILDVTADTMTLENSSQIPEGYPANAELFYITTTGGTFADMTFAAGDWLISLSTSWKQLQSGNQVSSVNAKTGAVTLDSDDIDQGVVNLYMRTTERAKLADIETRATRDVNVVQSAQVMTDASDNDFLRLTNKNGTTTDFYGGSVDLTDYLRVDGDASDVYANYTPAVSRQAFTGNESLQQFATKVSGWLNAVEAVAFTNSYNDLDDKPTYNDVELSGDLNAEDLGTLDVREVNDLPVDPRANTLYVWHTEKRGEPWTRYYAYTDRWNEIETGGFEVIGINTDPETTPPTSDAIYVHRWTDADSVDHTQVGLMLDGIYHRIALTQDILTDYADLDGKPKIDNHTVESGNQTHESLGLVGVGDFVNATTGKTSGMEFVLPPATPASPIVIHEIDDTAEMEYSTVHTSSNSKINRRFDGIEQALVGKLNLEFVNSMPSPPARNTQYYVATETPSVWNIYVVDAVGTVQSLGSTTIDTSNFVSNNRKVAGNTLDADITATQIADATKAVEVQLTNKIISADDNTLIDIATDNLKNTAISTAINSSEPLDTKLTTEKAVSDYAVPKTTSASKIYGTNSSGAANNYSLVTSVSNASTDAQLPTAKSIYGYAVPKTTDSNKVYGSSNNFDRVTSISNSPTDTQVPTAKAVSNFAVAKTTTADRVYGTNSSGGANLMGFSGTYTSTANNQLFTRNGANGLYNAVRNGEQAMVFCGNFTRNSTQSISATTSTKILLTGSDVYRTNLVSLTSNAIRIIVAGTYLFRFIGRLADTAGATRAWYLGGGGTGASSMADDQMGGVWSYTYNRHKAEATYLKYCAAGEFVAPWVYIDGNSGTLNYMTVEVFRLNNK